MTLVKEAQLFEKVAAIILIAAALFMMFGCVQHNVTLTNGTVTTHCMIAFGQDEGGVCWHGFRCDGGETHDDGCWTIKGEVE